MEFEYDLQKSKANKVKHGIDFEEAKELWKDEQAIEVPSAQDIEEKRYLVLGMINNINYTAVITYRDKNIRLISARRSRIKEVEFYESRRTR